MIANICGWSLQAKLVNLVTRLRGQAYAFFRSCTIQQKTSYVLLVAELQKRFTPVQLQTVQSSLFHDRKQKTGESVDDYAQDLRTLFHKAYPYAQQGIQEAERLGQLVLVNQFVAGLLEDIKAKVVGIEGGFDQLLSRARFEEAKLRDLAATSSLLPSSNRVGLMSSTQSSGFTANPPGSNNKQQKLTASRFHSEGQRIGVRCYNCGSPSHLVRQCPYAARSRSTETSGIRNVGQSTNKACVSNVSPAEVVSDNHEQTEKREEKINHESNDTDIGEDINKVVVTMHGVTSTDVLGDVKLGSVLTSIVKVEGEPVEALLDTGSPVTIISLEWLLQVLARQRRKGQNPDEWKAEVENRLAPTAMVLQNYSGDKLRIVRQIRLTLARSGFVTETLVQVQKGAPAKLLIGTDVLPQLGYLFVQSTMEGEDVDLLRNESDSSSVMEESVSEVNPTEMDANCDHNIQPMVLEAVGTVHLIQATKLPARHRKMVKTQVAGVSYEDCKLVIFEPNVCGMEEGCILMPEALTSVDINKKVVLVLENHGCEPIYLEAGQMLGWIYDATICPGWEVGGSTDVNALPDSTVAVSGGSVNMLATASGTNRQ